MEVVDSMNRPLALMPLDEVHKQKLRHRSVLVLLFNQDNKIYLQKRSAKQPLYPKRWDVSAGGHVLAGESTVDTAIRELKTKIGIRADRLKHLLDIKAGPSTGYEFVTVYSLGKTNQTPAPEPELVEGGYYYSRDELACLMNEFRELLTPRLISLWDTDFPFPSPDYM